MALTRFNLKKGDTRDIIALQLEYADGSTINGDITGAIVYFSMMRNDGTIIINKAVGDILDQANKVVGYQWQTGETTTTSTVFAPHLAEFLLVFPDGTSQTFPNSPESGGNARPFIEVVIWEDIPGDDA